MLRQEVERNHQLSLRLNEIVGLNVSNNSDVVSISNVMSVIWRYLENCSFQSEFFWYMMDEVGSAITNSDSPNVVCVPFIHITENSNGTVIPLSYTICWPVSRIDSGDPITRDFHPGLIDSNLRNCLLADRVEHAVDEEGIDALITLSRSYLESLHFQTNSVQSLTPDNQTFPPPAESPQKTVLTVYTPADDSSRLTHATCGLSHSRFSITHDENVHADILWLTEPNKVSSRWRRGEDSERGKQGEEVSPVSYINQFPYEGCLVLKDHLCREVAKHLGSPPWWHASYDMEGQVPLFVGDYLSRRRSHQENIWILKPSASSRSVGHIVSGSLIHIIRQLETDKKRVVQKYIERPLLWREGRKFDMRFVVFLRSCSPLELYVYDVFWTRIANNRHTRISSCQPEYTHPSTFQDRESVLTAMHLLPGVTTPPFPDYSEVVQGLEEMYPALSMKDVIRDIHAMLASVFRGVVTGQGGGMSCGNARSSYGCDVMLEVKDKVGGVSE